MRKICKLALVGAGYVGSNLLRNLISNQECELVYVIDKSEEKRNIVKAN